MNGTIVRVAAAQFPVVALRDWSAVEQLWSRWVASAAAEGADLLVFPEYAALSLATLGGVTEPGDLRQELAALQRHHADWLTLHAELARSHRVHVLAGSFPMALPSGGTRNRAHLFAPNGTSGWQDKWTMTRFETERWGIDAGDVVKVFETTLGRIGISICYDIEFPLIARAMVEGGAGILLAPSCTDTTAGYWRVRVGAQARALENQCAVVVAALVGEAPWSAAVDINVGRAGIYTPPDRGLPDDGVLALGAWNEPQWLYATIDADALAGVRAGGQVFNHRDWARQPGIGPLPPMQIEDLR